jgi:hypothetical protein
VRLSPLDSKRWKALSASASDVTQETLPAVMAFCRQHGVAFLIARCPATDLAAAQAMEREGFQLMDTLVYFSRDLERAAPQNPGQAAIRELRSGEDTAVRQVASLSFSGYVGHYHADPRLDRRQCDETYMDWAQRSCLSKEVADAVLVGTIERRIVAFAPLRHLQVIDDRRDALVPHSRDGAHGGVHAGYQRGGPEGVDAPWLRAVEIELHLPPVVLSSAQAGALTDKTRAIRLPRAPSH